IHILMKKVFAIALGFLLYGTACTKVDGTSTSEPAGQVMQQKTWRMTGFYDDGVDRLANFTGFAFTFHENGTVTAYKNGDEYVGTWATTTTRAIADSSEVEGIRFTFDN